jgi:hypothetical protein
VREGEKGAKGKQNPAYHISWGWNYNDDYTVMSVVNVPLQEVAWFGYNHPNNGLPGVATYADAGPYAVSWTGVYP